MIISYRSFRCTGHSGVSIFRNVQGWTEAGPGADTVPGSLSSSFSLEALKIFAITALQRGRDASEKTLGLQRGKQTRVNGSFTLTLVHL